LEQAASFKERQQFVECPWWDSLLKRHRLEKVRKALGDRVKKRMAELMAKTRQLAQLLLSKSCGALAYSDPLDA
jgi:hypothetical protein